MQGFGELPSLVGKPLDDDVVPPVRTDRRRRHHEPTDAVVNPAVEREGGEADGDRDRAHPHRCRVRRWKADVHLVGVDRRRLETGLDDDVDGQLRIGADDRREQRQHGRRDEHRHGWSVNVAERVGTVADEQREKSQRVEDGEDASEDGDGRIEPAEYSDVVVVARLDGGLEEQFLRVEAVEGRNACHTERDDRGDHRGDRQVVTEAAEFVDLSSAGLVSDDPGDQKQRGFEQSVIEQVEDAGFGTVDGRKAEARDHQAEVTRRRVGEQFLDVRRRDGHDRTDGHRRQAQRREEKEPLGADEHGADPSDEVDADLDHCRGVKKRRDRRRRGHRVGQPKVQRDLCGLGPRADREQPEYRQEQPPFSQRRSHRVGFREHRGQIERSAGTEDIRSDDRQQQEADEQKKAAADGDEHGHPGGVLRGVVGGVETDQDERGEAGEFPEQEDRDQVGRERNANDRTHEGEQGGVVSHESRLTVHVRR